MYSEDDIRQAINRGNAQELSDVYKNIFGKSIKEGCNNCYNEAIGQLISYRKKLNRKTHMNTGCKYQIAEKSRHKKFFVNIGGVLHTVTNENLTNVTAEAIIASGVYREGLIEPNPNYNASQPEGKAGGGANEVVTSSISKEALTDGQESLSSATEKGSTTYESKQLTGVKLKMKPGPKPKKK